MKAAISEVFETMFFVLVDFPVGAQEMEQDCCESRIDLNQAKENQQEIAFRFAKNFARMLTANFLSKHENEVIPEELQDAMRELANMVGGSYLSRLDEGTWQLGIPRFVSLPVGPEPHPERLPLTYFGDHAGEVRIYTGPRGQG